MSIFTFDDFPYKSFDKQPIIVQSNFMPCKISLSECIIFQSKEMLHFLHIIHNLFHYGQKRDKYEVYHRKRKLILDLDTLKKIQIYDENQNLIEINEMVMKCEKDIDQLIYDIRMIFHISFQDDKINMNILQMQLKKTQTAVIPNDEFDNSDDEDDENDMD